MCHRHRIFVIVMKTFEMHVSASKVECHCQKTFKWHVIWQYSSTWMSFMDLHDILKRLKYFAILIFLYIFIKYYNYKSKVTLEDQRKIQFQTLNAIVCPSWCQSTELMRHFIGYTSLEFIQVVTNAVSVTHWVSLQKSH